MSSINNEPDVSKSVEAEDIVKNAVTNVVNSCIEEGIMKEYLEEHAEEVIETLMLQWDNELAMQARFEEGREEGIEFVAINLIRMGLEFANIQKATDLPLQRIEQLSQKVNHLD